MLFFNPVLISHVLNLNITSFILAIYFPTSVENPYILSVGEILMSQLDGRTPYYIPTKRFTSKINSENPSASH